MNMIDLHLILLSSTETVVSISKRYRIKLKLSVMYENII